MLAQLGRLKGSGHAYFAQAVSPPFENPDYPRNYTSWTGKGLSVGGIQVDGNAVGGAAINPSQFAPGVILWSAGTAGIGWISVRHAHSDQVLIILTGNATIYIALCYIRQHFSCSNLE